MDYVPTKQELTDAWQEAIRDSQNPEGVAYGVYIGDDYLNSQWTDNERTTPFLEADAYGVETELDVPGAVDAYYDEIIAHLQDD